MAVRILITGVLGFIGRTLAEEMQRRNLDVEIFGIDIKMVDGFNADFVSGINYENLDIRNESEVTDYFSRHQFDGVIHLAAVSRVVDAENDKQKCIDTNYRGTKYVLENAIRRNRNIWFIFGSSREVYGEQKVFPVNEDAEKTPLNLYGFYKLEGERLVAEMAGRYFILRFSNVYGNSYDIPERVIPKFVGQALRGEELVLEGGGQEIDFTFIDDTVDAVIGCAWLLEQGKVEKECLHISPGRKNKITDIIEILREAGLEVKTRVNPPRNYDVEKFTGDPGKRRKILGHCEYVSLHDGLMKYISSLKRG